MPSLNVRSPFPVWIRRMVDNLAEGEGIDYEINTDTSVPIKRGPKRQDWLLTVDLAKKLHKFMGVNTGFVDWMRRMITFGGPNGFIEGVDYEISLLKNEKRVYGGQNKLDYMITMDMTKEIAMLQRTDKGWEVRSYFVRLEKENEALRGSLVPETRIEALRLAADMEEERNEAIKHLELAEGLAKKNQCFKNICN